MTDKPLFRAEPFLAHGTDNPITVRMYLQFAEILDAGVAKIGIETRDRVKKLLFQLMQDLLLIQDSAAAIDARTRLAVERLTAAGGIRRDGKVIVFADNPNPELRKLLDDGIVRAGVAVRRFRKTAGLIAGQEFKRGDSVYTHIRAVLSPDDPNLEWIEKDNTRLKEIMDLRGLVEHDDIAVEDFDGGGLTSERPHALPQRLNGQYTAVVVNQIAADLFGMMEDTLALLIQKRLPEHAFIRQLTEEESKARNGVRYALGVQFEPPGQPE